MSRVFLITGATGTQGGAVIDGILAQQDKNPESPAPTILGVTRNPSSASAKALASKSPLIKIVKGDIADPAPLFKTARDVTSAPVWGVFSVQVVGANEEAQGKALVDEAVKQGVQHFVQTSVDRGGDVKSWSTPTNIPHFITKHNIELHLRDNTAAGGGASAMTWTILRPVAFMDNFKPGFGSKVFLAALKGYMGNKPVQYVGATDIGVFGAKALLNGKDNAWKNKAVGIAGDELNEAQLEQVFADKVVNPPTATFGFFGTGLMWGVKEVRLMMNWFAKEGYGVDIKKCREINPEMHDFGVWLEKKSEFEAKK